MTEPVEPGGCRHCGIPARSHFARWARGVGVHVWAPPTNAQREERAAALRTARSFTAAHRGTR